MNDNEKQLLIEIDDLHQKLLQEPKGRMRGIVVLDPDCYFYYKTACDLKDKIVELRDNPAVKVQYAVVTDQQINSLYNSREVNYIKNHYSDSNKEKIVSLLNSANKEIDILFNSIFQKINDLKKEGEI